MNRDSDLVPMTQELPSVQSGPGRQTLFWILGALLVLVGGAFATAALLPVAEEVPVNTYIIGMPMSGLDRSEVRDAIDGPVATKVEGTVQLLIGNDVVKVKPSQIGIGLDRTATERALFDGAPKSLLDRLRDRRSGTRNDVAPVFVVNRSAAEKAMRAQVGRFVRAAKDATITLPTPSPLLLEKGNASFTATPATAVVVASVTGQQIDTNAAVTALRAAVAARQTKVRLTVVETRPKVSTAQASEVDQLIGTFTTEHPCCAPRVTNIHRIAKVVDGWVIAPGTTFSLNAATGRRTAEKGYVSAPAIADGELVDQFGGGVSQFSTTLFNAAWFSGLPILRHQPHSRYISRYPPGREATLDFDSIDQTIRNDTDSPVVIRTSTTGTSVTVALYGHTGDRKVESTTGARVPRTGGGFSISVQRVVLDSGSVTRRDALDWSYTGLD